MINLIDETSRFHQAIEQMKTLLESIDPKLFHQKPSEEEWSVAQVASHIDEAVSFWLDDIKALQIVPGAKWGRNHEHVRRLAAVADAVTEQLTPEKAIEILTKLDQNVQEVLNTITEEQLASTAPSYNPNFDQKPMSFIVDHLIVKHAEGHYGQMERHLNKVKELNLI
ncbi:DinB family protein [Rummeliibacillus sp. JY-2-4R]